MYDSDTRHRSDALGLAVERAFAGHAGGAGSTSRHPSCRWPSNLVSIHSPRAPKPRTATITTPKSRCRLLHYTHPLWIPFFYSPTLTRRPPSRMTKRSSGSADSSGDAPDR